MLRLAISNQRGGVGKTNTAIILARCFADAGLKVLLIDTDMQGSVYITLGLAQSVKGWLHELVVDGVSIENLATPVLPNLHVLCSDKKTAKAESELSLMPMREMIFQSRLALADYEVIIFDTAPSISNIHTCAIAYAKNVLCPVGMDQLSLEGAFASLQTIRLLNQYQGMNCNCLGFLPTQVDKRLLMTNYIMTQLKQEAEERGISLLPSIPTDSQVNKANAMGRFLHDFDPKSKALAAYQAAFELIKVGLEQTRGQAA